MFLIHCSVWNSNRNFTVKEPYITGTKYNSVMHASSRVRNKSVLFLVKSYASVRRKNLAKIRENVSALCRYVGIYGYCIAAIHIPGEMKEMNSICEYWGRPGADRSEAGYLNAWPVIRPEDRRQSQGLALDGTA